MIRRTPVVVSFVLLLLCGGSANRARADEKTVHEQIAALERKLAEQAAQIERLRAEQQALREKIAAQTVALAAAPPSAAGSPLPSLPAGAQEPLAAAEQTKPQPVNVAQRPSYLKSDRLVVGGYGSFRFEANNVGGNEFVPGGAAKSFTFRRFVLTADAHMTDRLRFHSELEFERLLELELEKKARPQAGGVKFAQGLEGNNGGEIGLEQLWLQYDLGHNQAIRAGLILPPLGRFNILHDDDYWDLPRRTLVDRDAPVIPVKTAWREVGAGLVGSLGLRGSSKLDYQVYVTNGITLDFNLEQVAATRAGDTTEQETEVELGLGSGALDGTKNAGAISWRVAFSPTLAGEVALSGYHAKYTPSFLPVTERVNAFGVDYKWRFRGFEIEGEGIYSGFGDVDRVTRVFALTFLQSKSESELEGGGVENEVEIELKGLARRRYGFWTDLKYHWRPPFLKKSFLGRGFEDPQLIPIVRYERVWLRRNLEELSFADGTVTNLRFSNRQQDRFTLGANYRPTQQVGFQFAYERNQRRSGGGLIFPQVLRNSTNGFLMGATFSF